MLILTINAGSSSLRSRLIKTGKQPETLAKGHIDGIGLRSCKFTFKSQKKNIGHKEKIPTHEAAIKKLLETLLSSKTIKSKKEITAIGHRVVHGGEKYTSAAKIDANLIKAIKKLANLAPLHNPQNLEGIKACKKFFPKTKQVAVFDTAFHQTMPAKAYLYGLPYSWYRVYGIRRYGFHGTSHKYVINKALELFKKRTPKIVSCHLGNGTSVTASINGKSIDTSMGFTPLEGTIMGTRCGSIDPEIIFHAKNQLKLPLEKIHNILNKESGIKGLSELSPDMRVIYEASTKKNPAAIRAIEVFSYSIAKYIGSYTTSLNGLDALVFTGGIGEQAHYVRKIVCQHLEFLGLKLDKGKNRDNLITISTPKSKVKVFVIPTNEELQIALETAKIAK